jgi:membrane fusion protein (multidrug efflux system)
VAIETSNTAAHRPGRRLMAGLGIAALAAFVASTGLVMAHQSRLETQSRELEQEIAAGPHVLVVPASQSGGGRTLEIPASVHGYIEIPVYAKVAGYMKTIRVDKGDLVRDHEVLAVIESPETDKAVNDARANYWLQLVTDRRDQVLVRQEVIPLQAGDTQHALMLQAKAAYEQELALQQYEIVRAPFDAIVTARYVDPGALIPESTATNSANTPIVALATLEPVRIYANMPQSLASFVRDGDPVEITVSEYPGRVFTGTVTRHPAALDADSRTMLVETDLPNRDHALLPGMYAEMKITTRASAESITVPDDALVFRNNKVYVPVVRDSRLHLIGVRLGRDDGYHVEISGDVHAGDLIAMNVGQAARDGEQVQIVRGENNGG